LGSDWICLLNFQVGFRGVRFEVVISMSVKSDTFRSDDGASNFCEPTMHAHQIIHPSSEWYLCIEKLANRRN